MLKRTFAAFAATIVLATLADAADVTIHITGAGDTAKYIKDGDTVQKDVTVKVGQTVKWANDMMTNKPHTATSTLKDAAQARIFDTLTLSVGASKEIPFTRALFTRAGGVAGGMVTLEYFCAIHGIGKMKSNIILDDTPDPNAAALSQARVVPRIVSVKLMVTEDQKSLAIDVTGEVPTGGFGDPRLVFAVYVVPPDDGMQDLYLLATPPTGPVIQVISQVEASTSWTDFKTLAPWIRGVRVHGTGAGIVEKMLP